MTPVKLRIVHCIVASILMIGIFCLVFFLRQDFGLRGWSDAFFIDGAILAGFGLLAWIAGNGVFDMMGYGLYRAVSVFKFKGEIRYKNADSFKEKRNEIRCKSPFFFQIYLIFGGVLLIAGIIFAILFMNVK